MVLVSYVIVLAYLGPAASNHFEWDNYHWGQQPGQYQQDVRSQPVNNEYHQQQQNYGLSQNQYQQGQPNHELQSQGQYHEVQQMGELHQTVQQNDQFQGYPPSRPLATMQPLQPSCTTASPTTQITPVPNSVPLDMPKHRTLLRQLYQQVLGQNFTSPAVQQLAFLSSPPSLPLNSQVQDYPQPQPAETQYDLPQYIEPPPPPQLRDQFNYYS